MKIMYLTNQLYLHGGIEKMLAQKINHWIVHYGYDVLLCTSEQHSKNFVYELNSKLKHIDLVINYERNKSYFHPKNLIKSITHFRRLKNLIKKEQPDIIISANYTPEQYLVPFIEKQIPKVKEFHSSGVTLKKPLNSIQKAKHRLFLLFNRYDALVVLNEDEKQYYPFKNLVVIPNFIAIAENEKEYPNEKTIIAAGRIAPVKQFDHLIKAWAVISQDFPEWQVKIFGEGDEYLVMGLNKLISELQVPNITLMGATNKMDKEMQKASIYAMTSATECFPMVLLEAQAASLPIVSYDCPNGPRHIIDHEKDGLLTSPNEIAFFARQLAKIMNNEKLQYEMGNKAKENVQSYTQENVMVQWHELLLNLKVK